MFSITINQYNDRDFKSKVKKYSFRGTSNIFDVLGCPKLPVTRITQPRNNVTIFIQPIIDGSKVEAGDVLIGLASSGPHSNGYSLIRKIIEVSGSELDEDCNGRPLADALLAPTKIYVSALNDIINSKAVHALAHITGGGLLENLPRVLPENTCAVIDTDSWSMPSVFQWLQQHGNVEQMEMYRTFNCGIGMVAVVPEDEADIIVQTLNDSGTDAWRLGQVEASSGAAAVRFK